MRVPVALCPRLCMALSDVFYFSCSNWCTVLSHYGFNLHLPGDFPGGSDGKASVYNAGDQGSIPGSGRSHVEGNGSPLQYSCLENPMDGGAW